MDLEKSLSLFYKNLTDRKELSLKQLFSGTFAVDTPLSGSLNGVKGLQTLLENEGSWMRQHLISVEFISSMRDEYRAAVELKLYVRLNGQKKDLPVILIGDLYEGKFSQIRIYHSTWPINEEHSLRAPIVWPRSKLRKPEVIVHYSDYLSKGETAGLLKLFTDDASVCEPSGTPYVHTGPGEREGFFTRILEGGPPGIAHAVDICTDSCYCVEYVCESWGDRAFAPIAGCTVYDISLDEKKISGIRVYDDVALPEEKPSDFQF